MLFLESKIEHWFFWYPTGWGSMPSWILVKVIIWVLILTLLCTKLTHISSLAT